MAALTQSVPSMIAIIFLGFLLRRINFLGDKDVEMMNKLIIYLTLPAMIFLAIKRSQLSLSVFKLPLFALLVMSLGLVLALIAGKIIKLSSTTLGAFLIICSTGNTGYLGFPLTIGLFGERNLVKAVFYDFGTVVFLFTVGILIAKMFGQSKEGGGVFKEFITFPSTVALLGGLLLYPFWLPKFLLSTLDYLSQATIPLIMLVIGLSLRAEKVSKYVIPLLFVVAIKLIMSPVIAFLVGSVGGLESTTLGVFVLEASMPVVMLSLVIGLKYKLNVDFISVAILVSTLTSLVTIPLGQMLLNLLT